MTPNDPNAPAPAPLPSAPRPPGWWLPWVVLGVCAVYLLSIFGRMNPPKQPYDLDAFGRIPVVDGGRVKPLDTVARVDLRMVSVREEFYDEKDDKQPAIKWYLDGLAGGSGERQGPVWNYPIFRIENDHVLRDLKLEPRSGLRYSLKELAPQIEVLRSKAEKATRKRKAKKPLDTAELKMLELAERVEVFINLSQGRGALLLPPQSPGEEWLSLGEFRSRCRREAFVAAVTPIRKRFDPDPSKPLNLTSEQLTKLLGPSADHMPAERRNELVNNLFRADLSMVAEENIRDLLVAFTALLPEAEAKEALEKYQADYNARVATNPVVVHWDRMLTAYRTNKPDEFNKLVREYHEKFFGEVPAKDMAKVRLEITYNRFAPFYQCVTLYVLVFLLSAVSWLAWTEPLRKSAFYLLYLTVLIHTAALIVRMYVQGRPPVTNLYSSAVFIGWGCVVLGLILERLYPIGIGNVLAAVLGLTTTIISHNLAAGGDTLEMMQAVLDTNFWLATHVTTITLGYTATFVAGFIGVAYIARMLATVLRDSFRNPQPQSIADLLIFGTAAAGFVAIPVMLSFPVVMALGDFELLPEGLAYPLAFLIGAAGVVYALVLLVLRASNDGVDANGRSVAGELPGPAKILDQLALDPITAKSMGQMIYGVLCFATLLSFVGTVLGGIWADQSWGRFWGWDPKENGAVLIVIWNALILHARWGGMVKDRGMAALAVVGNMITAWSWFGTNQLGIGLHAYGFDNRLAAGCTNFWASQLVILGLGLIPQRYWSSALRRATGVAPASTATTAAAPKPVVNLNPTPAPVPGPKPTVAPAPKPDTNGHQNGHTLGKGKGGKGKKHRGKRR